jgi:hypothetical protein
VARIADETLQNLAGDPQRINGSGHYEAATTAGATTCVDVTRAAVRGRTNAQ